MHMYVDVARAAAMRGSYTCQRRGAPLQHKHGGGGARAQACARAKAHTRGLHLIHGGAEEKGAHKHAGCSQKREDKEPGAKHLTHSMRCGPNRSKEDHADKAKIKMQKTMHINRKGEAE